MEKDLMVLRWFEDGDEDPVVEPVEEPKKEDEPKYTKADIEKAAARRQAALARARKAEEKAKALEDQLNEMPDVDEFKSLNQNYRELQQQLKELKEKQADQELQAIEDERERAKAKMEREFKKEREALAKQMEELTNQVESFQAEKAEHQQTLNKFRRSSLENEIISIAAPQAYNPRQIVKLIVEEFEFDAQDDKWYKNIYDAKGKISAVLSVEEYVKSFLSDKDNENLLKAPVKRGSDTPRGNQQAAGSSTPAEHEPTEKMYKWAEMSGIDVTSKSSAEDKTWLYRTYARLHNIKLDES